MKNQKEIEAVNNSVAHHKLERCERFGIKPNFSNVKLPTVKELAALAASLATRPEDSDRELCGKALRIWIKSAEALELQKFSNQHHATEAEAYRVKRESMPDQKHFPMTHDEFWRRMFPGKDTGERAALCKEFIPHDIRAQRLDPEYKPTSSEIAERFTAERTITIKYGEYLTKKQSVEAWHKRHVSAVRSKAAKNKSKKSLQR